MERLVLLLRSSPEHAYDALHESPTDAGGSGCTPKPVVVEGVIWSLLVVCFTLDDEHRIRNLESRPELADQSPPSD